MLPLVKNKIHSLFSLYFWLKLHQIIGLGITMKSLDIAFLSANNKGEVTILDE